MAHLDPELLSAYIDAELSPDEMAQVEHHLASCEECTVEYAELHGIATLVRELPTYQPREVIELGPARPSSGSLTMARIIEFAKPLAVAAIVLLVAFAGLRLLTDLGDENDDQDQISFSAVEVTPDDGTFPAARASESIAAEEQGPDAAGAPPDESGDTANTTLQEAVSDSEEPGAPAPAAALQPATVEPTAAPPTVGPQAPADGEEPRYGLIAVVTVVVVVIAGSAAWYTFARSPRHPRS